MTCVIKESQSVWGDWEQSVKSAVTFKNPFKSESVELAESPLNLQGGRARTHFLRVGKKDSKALIVMAGGIVNTAYRFAFLADELADQFEIMSFDWYGRGESDWLANHKQYGLDLLVEQTAQFLDWASDSRPVVFLGSSVGGLVAMKLFGGRLPPPHALILNDVGPSMPSSRRQRRALALTKSREFSSPEQLSEKVGVSQKNAGRMPDSIRDFLAWHNTDWKVQGISREYRYDMACMERYAEEAADDIDLWMEWSQIACPQLLIHGTESDALDLAQVMRMMSQARCEIDLLTIEGAGHTPSLCVTEQIDSVAQWIRSIV